MATEQLPTPSADGDDGHLPITGPMQGRPVEFEIDTSYIESKADLQFLVSGPCKTELRSWPKPGARAHVVSFVPQEPGTYTLRVLYNENEVDGSPFAVMVDRNPSYKPPLSHPENCRASGDGLTECVTMTDAYVEVETAGAGYGKLTMGILGPAQASITPCPQGPGDKFAFIYNTVEAGEYQLSIKWAGEHIPGSPFRVTATPHPTKPSLPPRGTVPDAGKVTLSDYEAVCRAKVRDWNSFSIDAHAAGPGAIGVSVEGPGKCQIEIARNQQLNLIVVRYFASQIGSYTMHVTFSEEHIPGSPFTIEVGEVVEPTYSLCS